MTVQGFVNPAHIIRLFISCEYAFSIFYQTGVEVRIAHYKGTWYVGRLKKNKVVSFFTYSDDGSVDRAIPEEESDPIVRALVEEIISRPTNKKSWEEGAREREGVALERVLAIFGGKTSNVERIDVVQPGRNATINFETGDFELSPREGEFKE